MVKMAYLESYSWGPRLLNRKDGECDIPELQEGSRHDFSKQCTNPSCRLRGANGIQGQEICSPKGRVSVCYPAQAGC